MSTTLMNSVVLGAMCVLACGYILHSIPLCRFFWRSYVGYVLYFRIIASGLAFLAISYLLIIFDASPWHLMPEQAPLVAFLIAPVIWTLVYILMWICFKVKPDWGDALELKTLDERGLDQFIHEKIKDAEMIMVTMENRKVYAGWSLEVPKYEEKQWLYFVPMWSGFRNEEGSIHRKVDYSVHIGDRSSRRNRMLIPVDKIVIVQPFDAEVFEQFNPEFKLPTEPGS